MSDSKVFMFPEQEHGQALLASALTNQSNNMWPMMAMMNGGMGGQWNNPLKKNK